MTRYPIYIPSKGRATREQGLTFRALAVDGVPFWAVVEPQERDAYATLLASLGVAEDRILVLPFSNLGEGSIPARNWILDHAIAAGAERHWQLDDNLREFRRLYRGKRLPCAAGVALAACETFTDRYTNIGISGLNYQMFVMEETPRPFSLNVHVYSCTLLNHATGCRWRGPYNEDTDLCLQVLAAGWCTVALNAFMANKMRTMTMRGGNSDELYVDDGRLRMAQLLERRWPGVAKIDRRFGRPQHVVDWRKFDTPLQRRDDIDFAAMPKVDEGDLTLRAVREVESPALRRLVEEQGRAGTE